MQLTLTNYNWIFDNKRINTIFVQISQNKSKESKTTLDNLYPPSCMINSRFSAGVCKLPNDLLNYISFNVTTT